MNKVILSLAVALSVTSCNLIKHWQVNYPDSEVEDLCEDMIESTTGIKIDLTPFTGEETIDILKHEF